MAGLHHANVQSESPEDPRQVARNSQIGLRLFVVYFACYAAFVLTNTFAPVAMEWTPIGGVNLAVLSGMGLIMLAVVMAFLYGYICRGNRGDAK